MRVLIADKFPPEKQAELKNMGLEVVFQPDLGPDDLPGAVGSAHVLIVRSTRVTEETIRAAKRLQLVIRAGAGTNTIDCKTAAALGIPVANCPGKNAIAVAELTVGLMVALDRHIPDCVADLRGGQWNKSRYGKARGLFGRTIGVIGAGRIGREVIKRAQGFGMKTIVFDPALDEEAFEELRARQCSSLEDLCRKADVVCVHVPFSDKTHHLLDEKAFGWMRPGTSVINASRGGVVDDAALAKAVESGHITAACDVYEEEPSSGKAEFTTPLARLAGFYGTHHIGASTDQAQNAVADAAINIVRTYIASGEVVNCVNQTKFAPASGQLVVRHLDKVGVLAAVLDVLKRAEINVQEMQNTIYEGAIAASARIQVERAPTDDEIGALRECSADVIGVEWMPNTAN